MLQLVKRYVHWLHGRWPAGTVEKLPEVNDDFSTNVPGVYVVGDLTGIPLLKLSADSGARAVQHICDDGSFQKGAGKAPDGGKVLDLLIIGGGVAGHAAAMEARDSQLDYKLLEASEPFSTIVNFPKGKPIYTYPSDMTPAGSMRFEAKFKEPLVDELQAQARDIEVTIGRAERVKRKDGLLQVPLADGETLYAQRVIVAIGRSGNYRRLDVPGEAKDKVYNRLHDPAEFSDKKVLVVGGGDSALETAIAFAENGASVALSYRKDSFSRPKPDNIERLEAVSGHGDSLSPGKVLLLLGTNVNRIEDKTVTVENREWENDAVFTMLGREAPLDFFRRSGIRITGESTTRGKLLLLLFAICIFSLYDWKNKAFLESLWGLSGFPDNLPSLLSGLGGWWQDQIGDRSSLIGTITTSMKSRSFYYTLLYTSAIGFFGLQRIRRRNTPYVTRQTITLFLVQLFPLFLFPEILFPYLDYNGFFQTGFARTMADNLFELYISPEQYAAGLWPEWGHPRAFWRAYGFILAWPLNVYNVNTAQPIPWWLVIGFLQTFVLIPLLIYRYGKGAYCGWICSCGALAETMGDAQRHKMPHGPTWNRVNMIGQVFLAAATVLFLLRVLTWFYPHHWFGGGIVSWLSSHFTLILDGRNGSGHVVNPLSYNWFVDILFGGFFGVAFYFKYSGRVWCRFACPLAALMHIYARFSRFRIIPEKKKCISCNVCTSVCHQGIDVMNFANKGLPMEDPQCVRCSACVQSCPTGVLQFGQVDRRTGKPISYDMLAASPVLMAEKMDV